MQSALHAVSVSGTAAASMFPGSAMRPALQKALMLGRADVATALCQPVFIWACGLIRLVHSPACRLRRCHPV